MEGVDVLGDDAFQTAQRLKFGNGLMGGIGTGVLEQIAGEKKSPLSMAGLRVRKELVEGEILRIELGPEASGAAEIGDAGFRADPRARKNDDAFRLRDQVRDPPMFSIVSCVIIGEL